MSKEKCYRQCQSCGMPFKKDPQGGGTEQDGSKSCVYCSYCYQSGEFTQPDITVAGMQDLVKEKMKELKMNKIFTWLAVKQIPRLKRWK